MNRELIEALSINISRIYDILKTAGAEIPEHKNLENIPSTILTMSDNLIIYKVMDMQRILREGGEPATDAEYENAEIYLQKIYKKVMEGEDE